MKIVGFWPFLCWLNGRFLQLLVAAFYTANFFIMLTFFLYTCAPVTATETVTVTVPFGNEDYYWFRTQAYPFSLKSLNVFDYFTFTKPQKTLSRTEGLVVPIFQHVIRALDFPPLFTSPQLRTRLRCEVSPTQSGHSKPAKQIWRLRVFLLVHNELC